MCFYCFGVFIYGEMQRLCDQVLLFRHKELYYVGMNKTDLPFAQKLLHLMIQGKDSECMLKVKERLLEILRIKMTDKSNKDIIKEK